jgi:hypothetical protein
MYDTAEVRRLNDSFRQNLIGGRVMMTRGIVGRPDCNAILEAVKHFDAFTNDNDPYGEHDFGELEMGRDSIFWKLIISTRTCLQVRKTRVLQMKQCEC